MLSVTPKSILKGVPLLLAQVSMLAFNMFVLDPIYIFEVNGNKDKIWPMLKKLEVKLLWEKDLVDKALLRVIMHKFLLAGDALSEMIVINLPSPATL